MNKVVFAVGGLLTLLGVGMFGGLYAITGEKPSFTALIPAGAGIPILLYLSLPRARFCLICHISVKEDTPLST